MVDGHLEVTKGNVTIKFNQKLSSGSSYLMCAQMVPIDNVHHKLAMINNETGLSNMSFSRAHQILGHAGPRITIDTMKELGYKVKSSNKKCRHCGKAKSTQKNISKLSDNKAIRKGSYLSIDITSSKAKSLG